jgi:hypothetical protein
MEVFREFINVLHLFCSSLALRVTMNEMSGWASPSWPTFLVLGQLIS